MSSISSVPGALAGAIARLLRMSSWIARLSSTMRTRRFLGPMASAFTGMMAKRLSWINGLCGKTSAERPGRDGGLAALKVSIMSSSTGKITKFFHAEAAQSTPLTGTYRLLGQPREGGKGRSFGPSCPGW